MSALGLSVRHGGLVGAFRQRFVRRVQCRTVTALAATPLLHRVASGEEGAVEACMDQFGPIVWALSRRMSPSREDANDAAQEIFIDLWSKAGRYDPDVASEKTFVAMIARRRLIDRLRKRGRQPKTEPLVAAAEAVSSQPTDPVETRDEARRVEALLDGLKPQQRQVIRLAVMEGWTHRQISERLDIPLGTVKTHVRRGLQRVRDLLGRGGEEAR